MSRKFVSRTIGATKNSHDCEKRITTAISYSPNYYKYYVDEEIIRRALHFSPSPAHQREPRCCVSLYSHQVKTIILERRIINDYERYSILSLKLAKVALLMTWTEVRRLPKRCDASTEKSDRLLNFHYNIISCEPG